MMTKSEKPQRKYYSPRYGVTVLAESTQEAQLKVIQIAKKRAPEKFRKEIEEAEKRLSVDKVSAAILQFRHTVTAEDQELISQGHKVGDVIVVDSKLKKNLDDKK